MTIQLNSMTEVIYEKFISHSIEHYAKENVKSGNWLEEEALKKSKEAFDRLLPDGLNSNQHFLLSIMNDGQPIGWLWYFYDHTKPKKAAFIYEFYIYEEHQGKGYGKSTLQALDKLAKEQGIEKISLHVFAHNERALHLYEKLGFEATDINMTKTL
ncbi:GNAT family N-acetyltransferase [Chengkuizengella axinellae]|uniref:GNAT family N-acetyltransferase n=1 Tax=Chengkuizengella axinellae TaxID=3064388 RepID=A0ABT9J447_9BACL|nr:GNAT family N-acetyltransferase [Chengkuizengella sp. 2205SS18-9]MDP5275760.1 GNAT family N-acetyltransferase [Chengkuizengella sp. 2205SS18-9]